MKQRHQYELVSDALYWLVENRQRQPGLQELAAHVGFSPSHLQRTFRAFAGVSPKQFLKFLTKEQALERLRKGASVLDAALDCGLSGTGRLHDLLITTEALTPGEARNAGRGVEIRFGYGPTPFGDALLGWTGRGISFLGFTRCKGRRHALAELRGQWPGAALIRSPQEATTLLERIFRVGDGQPLNVWLRGSPFQLKVWEALMSIAPGTHATYGQLAEQLAAPLASRAVGGAIGRNPVSWLIPCHRVITSAGTLGGYRWGTDTKQALIGYESALACA
jgi:AraC family transcriptional regulator of adaptative response/methylated-DNA-[protein]-cysteine methyltransferase